MASAQVTVKLRPIRLATLVPPSNRKALLRAISVNTVVWGGAFNPIIPLFNQRTAKWHGDRLARVSGRSLLAGFIEGYDPDYIVRTQDALPTDLPFGGREIIAIADVVKPMTEDGIPSYGVGLHEIVQHFYSHELRFVRRQPIDFVAPMFDSRYRTFLAAVFGSPPAELDVLSANWMEVLGARRPKVSLDNYFELLDTDKLFWRRLSAYQVRPLPRVSSHADVVFFLDATDPLDILDYWNLRAAGRIVYPVAKQSLGTAALRDRLRELVDDAFRPYRSNPNIYHHTQIVPSQSTTAKEVDDFIKWLDIAPPPANTPAHNHKLVVGYFPRLWDRWARSHGEAPDALESDKRDHPVSSTLERLSFPTLPPVFMSNVGFNGTHRYANEITIQHYGPVDLMAEVIPPGPTSLARAIGGVGFDDWRFAESGLVFLSKYKDWSISLELPRAEHLFPEWLKTHGWTASISPPGRIAKQMLKQLGGPWGVEHIANRRLIDLLERMSRGRPIKQQEFWAEIGRVSQEERWIKDPARTLKQLIDAHVFQLGVELQCPTCMQRSWYSVADADYSLLCPKCLETFRLPEESPREIKWAYRSIGPFSLESRSHGVYCVLLTFRFFGRVLDEQHTTMLSFEAKKDGKSLEADLAAFVREKAWWRRGLRVLFAECKTFNRFETRDVNRMRDIARAFPGAVLLFATLNEGLTNSEKRLIRPLATRGRRHWRDGASLNPVLVLTGKELFADERPEYLWKKVGGRHAALAGQLGWAPGINELCDATQQLYLDMPAWLQWFEDRMRRHRQRKSKRLSAADPKREEGLLDPPQLPTDAPQP